MLSLRYGYIVAATVLLACGGGPCGGSTPTTPAPEPAPTPSAEPILEPAPEPTPMSPIRYSAAGGGDVMLVLETAAEVPSSDRGQSQSWFMPTREEVTSLEEALVPYLTTASNSGRTVSEPLSTYNRRYVGFTREGRRQIQLQAFCVRWEGDWTSSVRVADGGNCFFNVDWDVESGEFSRFYVNGES